MRSSTLRSILAPAFSAILVFLALATAWAVLRVGSKAPDFKLKSIDGKTMTLSQIRGNPAAKGASRVVVLDFWATDCPPCVGELPLLQDLHRKYAAKGLAMVGVALDRGGVEDVKPFAKDHKLTYTMLVDPNGDAAYPYSIRYTPTTYVIDRKGIIRSVHIGAPPGIERTIEDEVKALLK